MLPKHDFVIKNLWTNSWNLHVHYSYFPKGIYFTVSCISWKLNHDFAVVSVTLYCLIYRNAKSCVLVKQSDWIGFSQVFSSFVCNSERTNCGCPDHTLSLVHGGHTSNVLSNMELNGQILFIFFEKVMVFMKSFLRSFHSLINPLEPVWVCFLANHRKMSNSVFSLNVVNL